jgi:hypothetical protein
MIGWIEKASIWNKPQPNLLKPAARPSHFLLTRHLHDLAPALGFGNEHGAEFPGVARKRNGAELAEPLPDQGVDQHGVDFPVQEIDDFLRRVARAPTP